MIFTLKSLTLSHGPGSAPTLFNSHGIKVLFSHTSVFELQKNTSKLDFITDIQNC